MIGSLARQSTLFYAPLASQLSLLKDDLLDPVDSLLDDPALVGLVRERLAGRYPQSSRTGRPGIAPDRLLRCCVLKHLKGWSFRELERELRCNLVYRRFTRFDDDPTPDFSTFSRTLALLGAATMQQIHDGVVAKGRQNHVATGEKLRTDTTVVETNIHHPSDSTLLADGVRVLTRSLKRISEECETGKVTVVNHARAVKHRVLEIARVAKVYTEANRHRLVHGYRKLLAVVRGVVRQTTAVLDQIQKAELPVIGSASRVLVQEMRLRHYVPLVQKVITQTEQRLFEANSHVRGKILSLFEPHSQVIRKGKPHKPTEFGRLVRVDEVEGGIVSHVKVLPGNLADTNSLVPSVKQHQATFGRLPRMVTADRGYFSAHNEKELNELGVVEVAVPAPGRLSAARAARQKERWFRKAQRWRACIEGRISTLKHPFSMIRARYKGEPGFERYVGWCVISHNLVSIARQLVRRKVRG